MNPARAGNGSNVRAIVDDDADTKVTQLLDEFTRIGVNLPGWRAFRAKLNQPHARRNEFMGHGNERLSS